MTVERKAPHDTVVLLQLQDRSWGLPRTRSLLQTEDEWDSLLLG